MFDKPSGTNRVNADKNQRKLSQICHVCLFEGSVYLDNIFYTLLACLMVHYIWMMLQKRVREFTAYLSDIFHTSPFCVSVSHIILTQLMWRLQVTLAKVN